MWNLTIQEESNNDQRCENRICIQAKPKVVTLWLLISQGIEKEELWTKPHKAVSIGGQN